MKKLLIILVFSLCVYFSVRIVNHEWYRFEKEPEQVLTCIATMIFGTAIITLATYWFVYLRKCYK
mgnify:CR=1 FL=1